MCDAFPIASPSTCSPRLLWALSLTPGLSVVLWDWPHRSSMILLWKELPSPLWEPQWLGVGPGHIIMIDSFLPIEMCDLGPGMNQGMGTISGVPFQHF